MGIIPLQCPFCKEPLGLSGMSYLCPAHHTFDISKKGIVNLLANKDSKLQGDTQPMLESRMRVHEAGFYDPLKKEVSQILKEALPPTLGVVVDVGCGAGLFFDTIISPQGALDTPLIGMDISAAALLLARKHSASAVLLRANAWRHIPVLSESVGLLFSAFAPSSKEECTRVLKSGGLRLIITAGDDHLKDLRSILPLAMVHPGKEEELALTYSDMRCVLKRKFSYFFEASRGTLKDIVLSGPSSYRFAGKDFDKDLPGKLSLKAEFLLVAYQK